MRARILTGVVGIPVVLGLTYLGGPWLEALVLLLVGVGALEASGLLTAMGYGRWRPLVLGGAPTLFLMTTRPGLAEAGPLLVLFAAAAFGLVLARRGPRADLVAGMGTAYFLVMYLGLTFSFWIRLRQLPDGLGLVLAALLVTWVNDTTAFFTGISVGRRKLAPLISPAKTVEGAVGGLAGAALLGALLGNLIGLSPAWGLVTGVAGGVAAQTGDLFVSAMKRSAGVKDTGKIIPGHGGVLDRFDSLSFVMPLFFYLFTSGLF